MHQTDYYIIRPVNTHNHHCHGGFSPMKPAENNLTAPQPLCILHHRITTAQPVIYYNNRLRRPLWSKPDLRLSHCTGILLCVYNVYTITLYTRIYYCWTHDIIYFVLLLFSASLVEIPVRRPHAHEMRAGNGQEKRINPFIEFFIPQRSYGRRGEGIDNEAYSNHVYMICAHTNCKLNTVCDRLASTYSM